MYIKKVIIEDIKSISRFEMDFDIPAGWHVIIGDNGAGKSTIVKAIALALLGEDDIRATGQNWNSWLKKDALGGFGFILLTVDNDEIDKKNIIQRVSFQKGEKGVIIRDIVFRGLNTFDIDKKYYSTPVPVYNINQISGFENSVGNEYRHTPGSLDTGKSQTLQQTTTIVPLESRTPVPTPNLQQIESEINRGEWFSTSFGPFRRFTGGSQEKDILFKSNPNLGAHLSIFDEDVALTEARKMLNEMFTEDLDLYFKAKSKNTFEFKSQRIINFINKSQLLPHNIFLNEIGTKETIFKDGYNHTIDMLELSDGYRSILSLVLELLRQLIRTYGIDKVTKNENEEIYTVDLPGVVIIDEIDSHLHPTWQTRIGQWFIKYFPKIQFIVTTHSPLICRACESGTIWRLATPNSENKSGIVEGEDRNLLIYGDILDAYGTDVFGKDVTISVEAVKKREELIFLSRKNNSKDITSDELIELNKLKRLFPSDDKIEI